MLSEKKKSNLFEDAALGFNETAWIWHVNKSIHLGLELEKGAL